MDVIIWLDDMVKISLDDIIDVIIWLDDNVIIWMITFIIIENVTHSPKCAVTKTALSFAAPFWRKRRMFENFKYLGNFSKDVRKYLLYCVWYLLRIELCKKG